MVRKATIKDAEVITDIYNYYIKNSVATFEELPVDVTYFTERIKGGLERLPWLVFEKENEVIGYSYANQWKPRSGYFNSVEISVYLREGLVEKGIGSRLYESLIADLKEINIHTIIGGICLPNDACIALHKKFGFTKIAHFKEIGYKFNKWVDVEYWQLTINKINK